MSYDDGSLGVRDDASAESESGGLVSNLSASLGSAIRGISERLKRRSEERPRLYVNQQVGVYDGQVEVIGPGGSPGAELEALDDSEE